LRVAEKGRVAEAKSLLATVRGAQMRYAVQNSAFATAVGNLDCSPLPTPKYFTMTVPGTAGAITDEAAYIGVATRTALDNPTGTTCVYSIAQNGTIDATAGGATCVNYL
jgi:hypothetical protein